MISTVWMWVQAHAVRIYAVVVSALALVAHYVPSLPSDLVLALVAAVLGLGEAAQRAETVRGVFPQPEQEERYRGS